MMTKGIDRREVLTVGTALAATSGLVLSATTARAQTEASASNFLQLDTARAIYANAEGFQMGLDVITSSNKLNLFSSTEASFSSMVPKISCEPPESEQLSSINVIGAILQVSHRNGDGNLVQIAQKGDVLNDSMRNAEELLDTFIVQISKLSLRETLARRRISFYSINLQFVVVEVSDYTLALAPVVTKECSLMDVIVRACQENIGIPWVCGD